MPFAWLPTAAHGDHFLDFLNDAPTVFHAIQHYASRLSDHDFEHLSERTDWTNRIRPGHAYYLTRNSSSLVAFIVGAKYRANDPIAMICTHMDAVTMKLKPVTEQLESGYEQLKVAPYAGPGSTWWDRDLGLAGRVLVKESDGKIRQRLLRLPYPFAKIPSLAEHFGAAAEPPFDKETQMTPIIGCTNEKSMDAQDGDAVNDLQRNHSPRLLEAIASELKIEVNQIKDFELELFDYQPASRLGLDGEFLSAPRCDDKLCSYAALEALIESSSDDARRSSTISLVACFDDEEVGSELRQGAASNLLPSVLERIIETLNPQHHQKNLYAATMAKSFLISADVDHAVNPNFVDAYGLKPRLNVGPVLCCDANANVTTDAPGKVMMQEIADLCRSTLQLSQIRNGQPSGGTIGPMLSTALGVRSVDLGLVQLGMHSIRGTTGDLDPGLGVRFYSGYFKHFAKVEESLCVD